jgi:hypothetical protein
MAGLSVAVTRGEKRSGDLRLLIVFTQFMPSLAMGKMPNFQVMTESYCPLFR